MVSICPLVSPDSLCLQRFEPSLGLLAPVSPMMGGVGLVPAPPAPPEVPVVKEIIRCQSCTLFPQNPSKDLLGGLPALRTDPGSV